MKYRLLSIVLGIYVGLGAMHKPNAPASSNRHLEAVFIGLLQETSFQKALKTIKVELAQVSGRSSWASDTKIIARVITVLGDKVVRPTLIKSLEYGKVIAALELGAPYGSRWLWNAVLINAAVFAAAQETLATIIQEASSHSGRVYVKEADLLIQAGLEVDDQAVANLVYRLNVAPGERMDERLALIAALLGKLKRQPKVA